MLDARSETFGLAARSRGAGSALRLLLSSRCTAETESRNAEGVARSALVLDAGDRCGTHDVGCLNRPISRVADCLDLAGTVQTYVADLPPPPEPPPADPLDFDRWVKWERCVRHAIDFMTFEYPLLSTAQIHEYLDRLPTMPEAGASGATFEQRLRRVANPDDPATLHTWLFETGGSAPLGSYFGTVPGAMRSR